MSFNRKRLPNEELEQIELGLRIENQPGRGAHVTARVPLPVHATPEAATAFSST